MLSCTPPLLQQLSGSFFSPSLSWAMSPQKDTMLVRRCLGATLSSDSNSTTPQQHSLVDRQTVGLPVAVTLMKLLGFLSRRRLVTQRLEM
jgi:hypothetical protein